jgi:hypothetical protein
MLALLFGALLLATASAECPEVCSGCLECFAFNVTEGACAGCNDCYDLGCTIDTKNYTDADGFGKYLKGEACESYALDFYGDLGCKSEAVVRHLASCYEAPLTAQYDACVAPTYKAELVDCVAETTARQVEVCLADHVMTTVQRSITTAIDDANDLCQDVALFMQGKHLLQSSQHACC